MSQLWENLALASARFGGGLSALGGMGDADITDSKVSVAGLTATADEGW
jgi:hypothetical protein